MVTHVFKGFLTSLMSLNRRLRPVFFSAFLLVATACTAADTQIRSSYDPNHIPVPPLGRWAASYTKEFAEKYNLPKENISTELTPGVDYMEMTTEAFGPEKATGCFVNFLIKQPNDLPFYSARETWDYQFTEFNQGRKLTRLLPLKHPNDIQKVYGYHFSSRDSNWKNKGFSESTLGFHSSSYLEGYDYITLNASCKRAAIYIEWRNQFGFQYFTSDVWGKFERKYGNLDDPKRPQGDDFHKSRRFIGIPSSLTNVIFQGVY